MTARLISHRFALSIVLAGVLLLISCSSDRDETSEAMVSVGTYRLHMRRQGGGSPAVIIDTGLGDRAENWAPIQERIASKTTVCVYDRAGYGQSEPGSFPRDSGRIARELKDLLEGAQIPGPYVLVGHSIGGLNMQVFAGEFRDDVAGVVLLDPPPLSWIRGECYQGLHSMADEMTARWRDEADAYSESTDPGERSRAAFLRTLASEHEEVFNTSSALAGRIATFGDIPLIVIGSGRPNPMFGELAEEYQKYWVEQSRLLAEKSENGRFVLAEGSSHNLYADEPELVVQSILSVVSEVRDE
ncbi:MAG: alpha/beta hydrolase [Phycisphaerales bacterium]|nr:MAG: alpha/beta hydrolase [Phycisphaerales bacterium]